MTGISGSTRHPRVLPHHVAPFQLPRVPGRLPVWLRHRKTELQWGLTLTRLLHWWFSPDSGRGCEDPTMLVGDDLSPLLRPCWSLQSPHGLGARDSLMPSGPVRSSGTHRVLGSSPRLSVRWSPHAGKPWGDEDFYLDRDVGLAGSSRGPI